MDFGRIWKNFFLLLTKKRTRENKKSTCELQVLFLVERMRIELTTS